MGDDISRLVDGELDEGEFEAACNHVKRQEGMATWVCYHVIGESLRGAPMLAPGFSERFSARLAGEPTVLAPRMRTTRPLSIAWAAAATMAAIAVTGWVAFSVLDPEPVTLAKAREATVVRAAQVKPEAVPQDYLLAHQEYSPNTQIQGIGPYIRAVAVPAPDARP